MPLILKIIKMGTAMPLIILITTMGTAMPLIMKIIIMGTAMPLMMSEIALQFQEVKFIGINLNIEVINYDIAVL